MDITHGIARYAVRQGALVLRNTLPYMPVGVHVAVVDPQVGTERRAIALRSGDGRILVGPDNGLLSLAWERCGGVELAVDITPLAPPARAGLGHLPRPRHLRAGGRAARRRRRAGRRGRPARPRARSSAWSCRSRARRTARVVAHALVIDHFGNVGLNVDHDRLAGTGITLGGRVEVEARRRALRRHLRADLRGREARRADRLPGRLPHARAGDQPRRRRPARSGSAPDAEVRLRPR